MNVLFENIKNYIYEKDIKLKNIHYNFFNYGDYNKLIYNTKVEECVYDPDMIKSLKDNGKLFVYESIKDDRGNLYGCERINDKHILSLETLNIQSPQSVKTITYYKGLHPDFGLPIEGKMNCSMVEHNEYLKDITIPGRDNGVYTDIKCNMYITNMSYDYYAVFGHDYRHISYSDESKEFSSYGMNYEETCDKIMDIKENGLKTPIIFELFQDNLYPIYGRVDLFAAMYLKLPVIPSVIVHSNQKFSIDNLYPGTDSALNKINLLLKPYIILYRHDKPNGFIRNIG